LFKRTEKGIPMGHGTTHRKIIGRLIAAGTFFLSLAVRADAPPAAALTLEDCYRRALKASEALAISDEEIVQAETRYRTVRAGVLPRAGFRATEFYQDTSGVANPSTGGGTFTAHHRPTYNFYAHQPIFSGFREFAGLKSLSATREARKFDRRRAAHLLYQDVSGAFYTVVEWDQQWTLLTALEKSSQDRMKDLRERVRIGRSRKSELTAAGSQLATIQAEVREAEGMKRSSWKCSLS
jgi:outer membrane protein TolC